MNEPHCWFCKQDGHVEDDCPIKYSRRNNRKAARAATSQDNSVEQQLRSEIESLRKRLASAVKQKCRVTERFRRLQTSVAKMLNPDQLEALHRKSTRGLKWTAGTIKKALRLRFSCGATGYDELRASAGLPLPGTSTLQQKLRHLSFSPGVLDSVFGYLAAKVIYIKLRANVVYQQDCYICHVM